MIKINIQVELDGASAPSKEAVEAVARHFYALRAACFWGESVSAKFSTSTIAESTAFKAGLEQLAAESIPQVNIQVEHEDLLKPLREKVEKNQPSSKPFISIINEDEDQPLMRPTGKVGLVSERKGD